MPDLINFDCVINLSSAVKHILFLSCALTFFFEINAQPAIDSLSATRNYPCACELGGKLFITGDIVPGTDTVDVFDSSTGTWSVSVMDLALRMPMCRTVGSRVYVMSTTGTYNIPLQDHIINYYDNISSSWSTDTVPLYINHFETIDYDVQVYDGRDLVFLSGSQNAWGEPARIFMLNTLTHTWSADTIPDSLSSDKFSIWGDEAVWTSSGTEPIQYLVRYNLTSKSYSIDTLPVNIQNPILYSAGNKTFITGGQVPFTAYTSIQFLMYDHLLDTIFTESASLGTPSILRYGNNVIFSGQGTYSGTYSSNSSLILFYDIDNDTLLYRNMSQGRVNYGLTANCGKFYLAGGFSYNQSNPIIYRDTVDMFDTLSFSRSTDQLTMPRAMMAAGSAGNYLVFAGGTLSPSTLNLTPLIETYTCQILNADAEVDEMGVTVFPNPAMHYITLNAYESASGTFILFDSFGKMIREGNISGAKTTIEVSDLTSGMYLLRMDVPQELPAFSRLVITR
jgi:hypothetical protein